MRALLLVLALFGTWECSAKLHKNRRAGVGWKTPAFLSTSQDPKLQSHNEDQIIDEDKIGAFSLRDEANVVALSGGLAESFQQTSSTESEKTSLHRQRLLSTTKPVNGPTKPPNQTTETGLLISDSPSLVPSLSPSIVTVPGVLISDSPSLVPSVSPSIVTIPGVLVSDTPSLVPSVSPSIVTVPGVLISDTPSLVPSVWPSIVTVPGVLISDTPSLVPSVSPSIVTVPGVLISDTPSLVPSVSPSILTVPGELISDTPSLVPSVAPSIVTVPGVLISDTPSLVPSVWPSIVTVPGVLVSDTPSLVPSVSPSIVTVPGVLVSDTPSLVPSVWPSIETVPGVLVSDTPSLVPSQVPSGVTIPAVVQSDGPSTAPTLIKAISSSSDIPSIVPSLSPSFVTIPGVLISDTPSFVPSDLPSAAPSRKPSFAPSISHNPSDIPSFTPSDLPSTTPSAVPTSLPSATPSAFPSRFPSTSPSDAPSNFPSKLPSSSPSRSSSPSHHPSGSPSSYPSSTPSAWPSGRPRDVATNGTIVLSGISSTMNAGNITIFEKTATTFLEENVQSVDASQVEVTSFEVLSQSVVGSGRRRLQRANTALEVIYRVEAVLYPGHSQSYNFSGQVATMFQAHLETFQQSLSHSSSFFPAPLNADSLSRGQPASKSGRRITMYVVIGGGLTIVLFILIFTKRSFSAQRKRKTARLLINRRLFEKEKNRRATPRGGAPNHDFIGESLITESSSGPVAARAQPSISDDQKDSQPSEKQLQLVLSMSNEVEACPMCVELPGFEKKDQPPPKLIDQIEIKNPEIQSQYLISLPSGGK